MIDDDIKDAVHQYPLAPFRIVTSSGESYVVRNPDLVVRMRNRVFIAMPGRAAVYLRSVPAR